MIYSVWDWDKKTFDYYQSNEPDTFEPKKRPLSDSGVGVSPEQAAIKLPENAVYTGSGTKAKGMIAVDGVDFDTINKPMLAAGILLVGFAVYRLFIK